MHGRSFQAVEGESKQVSIRLVEQNFALFSKELVDLVLDETRSCACQPMIHAKVKTAPTDTPNVTSQVQEFFARDSSESEVIRKS